ncbi:hypothetical protein D3C75_398410 [compost metagenome]
MHHSLLIPPLIDRHLTRRFLKCLPQSKYIAMAENGEYTVYKTLRSIAKFHILLVQKFHQRLRRR